MHIHMEAITLFDNSIHHLKHNGIYIIDDVNNSDLINFKNYFDQRLSSYNYNTFILHKSNYKKANNNLIEIRKVSRL